MAVSVNYFYANYNNLHTPQNSIWRLFWTEKLGLKVGISDFWYNHKIWYSKVNKTSSDTSCDASTY